MGNWFGGCTSFNPYERKNLKYILIQNQKHLAVKSIIINIIIIAIFFIFNNILPLLKYSKAKP
jgi:beta-lactamase regulating signal transducer with metallopeptidase domain